MKTDDEHLSILCDMSEVFALLAGSSDIEAFLHSAVSMVAKHLDADVSSVYLFAESTEELVLSATVGLNPQSVGDVRMGTDEGLVGLAMRELRPISVSDASLSPHYKYFPDANEDAYGSFAAVPIQRGTERIGVLTVQRPTGVGFRDQELKLLRVLTSQLAVAIENARVMLCIENEAPVQVESKKYLESCIIAGTSASARWGLGEAVVERRALSWDAGEAIEGNDDIDALNRAVASTEAQLEHLHAELEEKLPEVASMIFSAHLMMLKDSSFTGKMRKLLDDGIGARDAVVSVAGKYISFFENSQHDYMREKSDDVKDLGSRILASLRGGEVDFRTAYEGKIVVAEELLPSEILKLSVEKVAGIVLYAGGVTSHVAILARSLGIPMVIAEDIESGSVPDGCSVLVDANVGNVYIKPPEQIIEQFELQSDVAASADKADEMLNVTQTSDGTPVSLLANINLLSELDAALRLKAEGVGLYRTEFPFLVRQSFPTEEEQVRVYKVLFDTMEGRPVTVRTLDVGGDKALVYFDRAGEPNPELGLRSLRFSFKYPDIFRDQIRAIVRASGGASFRIMFPMVSSLEEFRWARDMVCECCDSLGVQCGGSSSVVEIGMMIEVPSVVEIIDELSDEVDFFSVGTNDFVQYMLAADRVNERVAEYYTPGHPGVLRAISKIVKAANAKEKDVTICGEMAHDPRFVPFFIGVGVRRLSVDPVFLLKVQKQILELSLSDAQNYSNRLIACSTSTEIESLFSMIQ